MFKEKCKLMRAPLIILIVICVFSLIVGCKGVAAPLEEAPEEPAAVEEPPEETAPEEEAPADEAEVIEEAAEEEEVEEEAVPAEITGLITKGDDYYDGGDYSMARKSYRDGFIAIDGSNLSEDKKDELKGSFDANYQDSASIIETAMLHFGNAMTLEYEKRFEEAKVELEASLVAYPKYQEALDALESLKALMGLN